MSLHIRDVNICLYPVIIDLKKLKKSVIILISCMINLSFNQEELYLLSQLQYDMNLSNIRKHCYT